MSNDKWIANCSDGSTHEEEWLSGHLSPWQRLMQYCEKQHCYITSLALYIGTENVFIKDAIGFWQAHGQNAVQGLQQDEELDKMRGIGWVMPNGELEIIWGAYSAIEHEPFFWVEHRDAATQRQIIWSNR